MHVIWIRHFSSGSSVMTPEKPLFSRRLPRSCGHRPAVTSNPVLPGDVAPTTNPSISLSELPSPSSWRQTLTEGGGGVWLGGVDRKLVEGQGPSSLITPMPLQRQKPTAFDIGFILVFCSFVQMSLCGLAAGVSIITSCFISRCCPKKKCG